MEIAFSGLKQATKKVDARMEANPTAGRAWSLKMPLITALMGLTLNLIALPLSAQEPPPTVPGLAPAAGKNQASELLTAKISQIKSKNNSHADAAYLNIAIFEARDMQVQLGRKDVSQTSTVELPSSVGMAGSFTLVLKDGKRIPIEGFFVDESFVYAPAPDSAGTMMANRFNLFKKEDISVIGIGSTPLWIALDYKQPGEQMSGTYSAPDPGATSITILYPFRWTGYGPKDWDANKLKLVNKNDTIRYLVFEYRNQSLNHAYFGLYYTSAQLTGNLPMDMPLSEFVNNVLPPIEEPVGSADRSMVLPIPKK